MLRALCLLLTASLATAAAPAAPASAAKPEPEHERGPAYVALEGRGFGHGRGMSQYGAQIAAAEHGRTYRQILRFYYPGLAIGNSRGTIRVLISGDTSDDVVVRDHRGLVLRAVATGNTWKLSQDGATRWRLTPANGGADTRLSVFTNRWRAVRTVAGEAELTASGPIGLVTPAGVTRYQ